MTNEELTVLSSLLAELKECRSRIESLELREQTLLAQCADLRKELKKLGDSESSAIESARSAIEERDEANKIVVGLNEIIKNNIYVPLRYNTKKNLKKVVDDVLANIEIKVDGLMKSTKWIT